MASNGSCFRCYLWLSVVIAIVLATTLLFVVIVTPPSHDDAYYLSKIPIPLRSNSVVSQALLDKMKSLDHVSGNLLERNEENVSRIKLRTSTSPAFNPDIVIVDLLVEESQTGVLPMLRKLPGIQKVISGGSPGPLNIGFVEFVVDGKTGLMWEIHDNHRSINPADAMMQLLLDQKARLKTADDEEKLWNLFAALHFSDDGFRPANWISKNECEFIVISRHDVKISIKVDNDGYIKTLEHKPPPLPPP